MKENRDEYTKLICDRIKQFRQAKHLKIKELADIAGMTPGNLSVVEKGEYTPSAWLLTDMVRNADLNANWLFTGEGEMFRSKEKEKAEKVKLEEQDIEPVKALIEVSTALAQVVKGKAPVGGKKWEYPVDLEGMPDRLQEIFDRIGGEMEIPDYALAIDLSPIHLQEIIDRKKTLNDELAEHISSKLEEVFHINPYYTLNGLEDMGILKSDEGEKNLEIMRAMLKKEKSHKKSKMPKQSINK